MNNKLTLALFEEAYAAEDNLDALSMGYYDTHDLDEIEENKESYEDRLKELKELFGIPEDDMVCQYTFNESTNELIKLF